MLDFINMEKILFLDIETVSIWPDYQSVPELMKPFWDIKASHLKKNDSETPEMLYSKAGIYAEFSKIICISVAYFHGKTLRVKSFSGHDEKELLVKFATLIKSFFKSNDCFLAAHNGKEFDFPFIARRMVINEIPLPHVLDNAGKKPWEVPHLDTMELWKFGDYKHYTSLSLLATILGIPTPKNDIDGSMVSSVYWLDNDLERIVRYCQRDTITVARLICRYKGLKWPEEEEIVVVS
jgi:uncharacterized protein YprB with RNaseH-like and TPR domain